MLGVSRPTTGSLTIRKSNHGVQVDGVAPEFHAFPQRFLKRELTKTVRAYVAISTAEGYYQYEITDFDENEWRTQLVASPSPTDAPKRRFRFFRRK